ncbi:sortase [Actinocrispum sp. NPDC049592]|uniref:sortase domain-containing protein n=1 Tax=Actinocrispum sp. NPDC049592 TaxID=3154835 RepID=UPI003445900F
MRLLLVLAAVLATGASAMPAAPKTVAPLAVSPRWVVGSGVVTAVAGPVRVRVPAVGVDGPVVGMGVDAKGVLVPPANFGDVGWFGVRPGEVGPAVLAGHVDSRSGPAVFFRLRDVRIGDQVVVDRVDGSSVSFTVVSVIRVAKTAFPTADVYSPVPVPTLRLVTCGGSFDHSVRSYRDNIIVEAT